MANASIRIGASTSEYQTAMKNAVASMKQLSSQYSLTAANAKLYGTQSDALKGKITELTAKMEVQKTKIADCEVNHATLTKRLQEQTKKHDELKNSVEKARTAYEESARATGTDSEETKKLKSELEKVEKELKNSEQQLTKTNTQIKKQETATTQANAELANMQLELREVNAELARQKFDQYAEKAGKVSNAIGTVGKGMTKVTAAISGVATAAVTTGATFEQQMSKVKAISGATTEDTERLTEAAREWGKSTQYSATEAGQAFEYMALAGWSTNDMLNGIGGVLNLAAASAMDLGTASDIVTDYLTAFGLSAQDAGKFADEMAYAMSHSNTTTEDLGEAYKNCAATAASMGYSVEETTAVIMTMANAGVKGGEAGTALNAIMTRLATDTKDCATSLAEYGVQIYDSEGNMNSLSSILTGIRGVWNTLTDEQQANLAKTIAGTNQYSALQTIMSGLSDATIASGMSFNDYNKALQSCDGTASDMAETMQDNLQGQVTQLKSKLQDTAITLSNVLLPAAKEGVDKISNLVDRFASLTDGQQKVIIKTAGIVAMIGPALMIVSKLVDYSGKLATVFGKLAVHLATLGNSASGATGAASILRGAIAAITSPAMAVTLAIAGIAAVITTLWKKNEGFRDAILEIWNRIKSAFTEFGQHIADRLNALGFDFDNFTEVVKQIWEGFCNLLAPVIEGVFNYVAIVIETALNVITGVFDFFIALCTGDWKGCWEAVKEIVESIWNGIKDYISNILNTLKGVFDVFLGFFGTTWSEVWTSIRNFFEGIWEGIKNFFSNILNGIKDTVSNVFEGIGTKISDIWNGIKTTIETVCSGIKETVLSFLTALKMTFVDIFTEVKSVVQTVFDTIKNIITVAIMAIAEIFNAAYQILTLPFRFIWENCKDVILEVWTVIQTKIQEAIDAVAAVITAVWTAVKDFFVAVWTEISSVVSTAWQKISETVETITAKIQAIVTAVWTAVKDFFVAVWTEISSVVSTAWQKIRETIESVIARIQSVIIAVWTAVKDFFVTIWTAISTIVSNIINNIKDAITNVFYTVKTNITNIFNDIKTTITNVWTNISTTVSSAINNIKNAISSVFNEVKNTVSSVFDNIKNSISNAMNLAKETVSNAINAIKSKFNFTWSLPKLKLPHPKITGEFSLDPPSVPHFSIDWYKNGAIMNSPMIFGANGNTLLAGGEPETGGEAILPLRPFYVELNNILDKKLKSLDAATNVMIESYTYIDSDEVASRTYTKVDGKFVEDKRKGR